MDERLTKTRVGNWMDLSFFSFREDPRPPWDHPALLAGTLDKRRSLSSHFARNFQAGFSRSSISGPLEISPDLWPMTLACSESPKMRPAGRLVCELLGGILQGIRAGRPSGRGRRLWRRCPAWKPPLQPVGHRGQPLAFEPPGRRGSGSRVDCKDRVSDSGPPRRPVAAGLTREMVRGTLKSRPPTRRKPQGEGPRRVTEWGIASQSCSRSLSRTLRSRRRRRRRRLDAAPRPWPARPRTPLRPAPAPAPRAPGLAPRPTRPSHFGGLRGPAPQPRPPEARHPRQVLRDPGLERPRRPRSCPGLRSAGRGPEPGCGSSSLAL